MKGKLTILFLCLLVLGLAQNECEESRISLLQTGEILLNTNDLGRLANTTESNKNYQESLARGKFGKTDYLGSAFAIAGFETSCSQKFYSLVVDVVQFQNENTKMRIVIDFRNQALDTLTVWTRVKLTYLVVSASKIQQGETQANIWATSAEITFAAAPANGDIFFRDDIFAGTVGGGGCGLTFDIATGYNFDVKCDSNILANDWDHDVAIHAYIMGFKYQPDTAGANQFLAANANWQSAWPSATQKQLAAPDNVAATSEKTALPLYGVKIVYDASPLNNNGPRFQLSNYGGQLKSIKIAIVLTTIMPIQGAAAARNAFTTTLAYSYSGLYNPVPTTAYNIRTLIDDDDTKDWNNLHEKLPIAKYKIYGLSRFELKDGSGCSSFNIDLSIDTPNSYTLTLNNKDYVSNVVFQSDIFFPATNSVCSPGAEFNSLFWDLQALPAAAASTQLQNAQNGLIGNLKYMKTRKSQKYTTVPSNNLYQSISQIGDNPLDLEFSVNGIANDRTNVRLNAEVVLSGITDGKPYGVRVYMKPTASVAFVAATDGTLYQFSVKVNGLNLYTKSFTAAELTAFAASNLNTVKSQERYGVNLVGTTAKFQYSLTIPRNPTDNNNYDFELHVDLFEFVQVYDPVTQCCVSKCPASNGLDIGVTPPICVVCDTAKGLTYDPSTGSCKCADTFYLNSKLNFQCFPCQTKLCAQCDPTKPSKCLTCLAGASLSNLDSKCTCSSGFYENNGVCTQCAPKCSTCKVASTCDTCSDSNRDFNNGCSCVAGYYDAGVDKCQKCNPSCFTCSNANTCVTCDARTFRTIKNGLCVCQDGYFELIYENGVKQCKPCSSECKTCIQSAIQCTSCDSNINRIQGYDSLNHRTCICKSGYHALTDGSCVQSNCKTDDLCSQCQKDLALCVQCRATLNRVLKLPENICVCGDGFYEDATTKTCKPCADGCAQCTSLTKCTACVAGATNNNDGSCKCSVGTFFGIATNGVRYCQKCLQYCDKCSDALSCQTCKSPFQLSTDKTCFCPKTNWINPNGDCVPCKVGCETCTSSTTCSKCVAPLVVQQNSCVAKCSDGYFLSGSTCIGCPSNCVGCTSTNQCFYCKDGFFLSGGACYASCPSGTVANTQTFQCIACNSPCRTCTNHPSSCTSCEPGEGYLQVTGDNQKCVKQCAQGTFPKDNVCQVCDFRCAKCLGASNNCIACPTGRYLYNGACWDYCPGVMVNNQCVNQCPAGYWRVSDQQCKPCSSECKTCDSNSTCLTCANNFLSLNGKCVAQCGNGYYSFRGICVACDKSCQSCRNIPTQCIQCAKGFVRSNDKCVSTCAEGTYLDNAQGLCRSCSSTCKTCTAQNFCISCPNSNILPVGGQCYSCIYPCESCSKDLSVCNACVSGFYLSDGQCLRACPTGTRPLNGVCSCSSGTFLDGACVANCPSGYTKVGTSCKRCISPCTECSGNENFCTDCLDTYILRPNTGKCDQTSNCNYGQQAVNGKCERICDEGSYYQNGACIFGGCPDGFKDNGFGGCVVSSVSTNVCQVPTFKLNSVCVEDCGRTFFPNSNTRTCDSCSTNCQNCLNRNFCVTCATGFTALDGRCVANSNCAANQFSYNSACVAVCPAGTFTINGRCIRSCATGSFYFGGFCYDTCPTQARLYTDNACVAVCPTGTTLIDGVCATLI